MRCCSATLVLLLAVLSAGHVVAESQDYALGTVRVTNGHPVAGVDDGVVFSQAFDSSCGVVATEEQGDVKAVSQPRLRSLNNQMAVIKVGTEQPFLIDGTTRA